MSVSIRLAAMPHRHPALDTASNEKLAVTCGLPPFFDLLAEVLHAESDDLGDADWRRRSFPQLLRILMTSSFTSPMTAIADYASVFEARRRRRPRPVVLLVWMGLFLVRPALALQIWRERR